MPQIKKNISQKKTKRTRQAGRQAGRQMGGRGEEPRLRPGVEIRAPDSASGELRSPSPHPGESRCDSKLVPGSLPSGGNMDSKCALREETEQLVADYLEYSCRREGSQERPPSSPAAATLRSVAKELRRRYQDFFECAQNQLLDQSPEQVISEVAELMSQGEFNWGRVAVLVVFAGALLETEEPQKEERVQQQQPPLRREMSRRLAEELSNYLVEKKGAWLQENGGWTGFHHHFTQKQSPPQSDPSSTLCCIMAAAAGFGLVGLALLLAVR